VETILNDSSCLILYINMETNPHIPGCPKDPTIR